VTIACPLCGASSGRLLYAVDGLPLFQNRTYANLEEARAAPTGRLELMQCERCGFGYNARFEEARMTYDDAYQNEQGYSGAFCEHLEKVCEIVLADAQPGGRILEIGCGKGTFLGLLKAKGARVRGFDPAYEGSDPDVVRDYFRPGSVIAPADLIVLRHTLEHVAQPLAFLRQIAEANEGRGKIFIEVPDFDWIVAQGAFWDLFYEHCNYFGRGALSALFRQSQWHSLFGGQYQGIVAELGSLVERVQVNAPVLHAAIPDLAQRYDEVLDRSPIVFVWGAASNGVIF
jgi:SAM-dependent methyltransferase